MKEANRFLLLIIGANLIIGNGYLVLANADREPNYALMLGMSLSCCIIFSLMLDLPRFIKRSWWQQLLKLVLINLLTVVLGTVITYILRFPFSKIEEDSGVALFLGSAILMGIAGSLLFFWFSFGMSVVSFIIVRLLRKNMIKSFGDSA